MRESLWNQSCEQVGPPPCRTLRQEVYTAYETRASSGSTNNSPVVEQIMSLRQEQARLAGYSNAAEYLMSNKVSILDRGHLLIVAQLHPDLTLLDHIVQSRCGKGTRR